MRHTDHHIYTAKKNTGLYFKLRAKTWQDEEMAVYQEFPNNIVEVYLLEQHEYFLAFRSSLEMVTGDDPAETPAAKTWQDEIQHYIPVNL